MMAKAICVFAPEFSNNNRRALLFSLCQTISWVTVYFSFAILIKPIQTSSGWTTEQIVLPFSCALLLSGLSSLAVGELISRFGSRCVIVIGSIGMCCALLLLGFSNDYVSYFFSWIIIGLLMEAILYQPLFAWAATKTEKSARYTVSSIILFNSFSRSIAAIGTGYLVNQFGWHISIMLYSLLHLINAVIYFLFLPNNQKIKKSGELTLQHNLKELFSNRDFWILSNIFTIVTFINSGISVNIMEIFTNGGNLTRNDIISIIGMGGIIQFITRVFLINISTKLMIRSIGFIAFSIQALGFFVVSFFGFSYINCLILIFCLGYSGSSINLIKTSLLSLEFKYNNYARAQGALNTITIGARALGPIAMAIIYGAGLKYRTSITLFFLLSMSVLTFFIYYISRKNKRNQHVQ